MKVQRSVRIVCALFLLCSFSISSKAQRAYGEGRWDYLGQAHADGRVDHDKIHVSKGGAFRAIQFEIKGGAIEFRRVVVHFEDGADHDVEVRERVLAGGRSRAIDLPGNRRRIRSVEFWYGSAGWGSRRPTLNLWGRR